MSGIPIISSIIYLNIFSNEMQILLGLLLVIYLKHLLQTMHNYFAHSPKRHLEFTRVIEDFLECEIEMDFKVEP